MFCLSCPSALLVDVCLSVCLFFRSVGLNVCSSALLVCLFGYLSVVIRLSLLSVDSSSVCLSVCLSVGLSGGLSGLSVRSVCPVCLSIAACVGIELRLCVQRLAIEDTDDDVPALDQSS